MYRYRSKRSLEEEDNMEVKIIPGESQEQFLTRVGSLPIVTAALGQLWTIYSRTKESNGLVKFTLESAETGAKVAIATAQPLATPVLNKLERPIGSLNLIACNQLDKLEEAYPIITKPADQVLEGTLNMYNSTLKPSVDSVYQNTVKSSVDKVTAAKQYGAEKVSGAKQCGYQAIESTCGKLVSVKNYGQEKITGVAEYGLTSLDYGHKAVAGVLDTPYGQNVVGKIDGLLDVADQYVEHYLPAEDKEERVDPEEKEKAEVDSVETPSVPSKVITLSDKVRQRMYRRTVRQLQRVHLRSKETLEGLNFTVNLIQYAKDHMDGARGGMVNAGEKAKDIWAEINQPEDSDATTTTNGTAPETDGEEIVTGQKVDNVTLERRAIATARHLTARLKGLMGYLTTTVQVLPNAVQERASQARVYSDHLYSVFSTTELKVADIPQVTLDLVRSQVTNLQDSLTKMTDYLADNKTLQWLIPAQVRTFLGKRPVVSSMIEIELSELNEEDGSSVSSTQEPEETLETSENLNTTYLSSEQDASFNCTSSEENLSEADLEK